MTGKRVLFVYTRLSTFVKGDIDILEKEYRVTPFCAENRSKGRQFLRLIRLFFYLLFNTYKFDIIYVWFADYHSFLPVLYARIFRKKCFVVIGGYDVCRIRSIKYGSFVNPVRGFMARYSMNNATLCLCVSRHVERIVRHIALKSLCEVLHNGVVFSSDSLPKEMRVLSVALSSTKQSFFVKGIDRYIELARFAPDLQFTIIGPDKTMIAQLIGEVPSNLEIISRIPQQELSKYYSRSAVYCQLSRSESFAVALAEAMFHNCVPVIANTGGMAEVTGNNGFIVHGDDPEETAAAIREAMKLPPSEKYRERIIENFTIEIRARRLSAILEGSSGKS
ncbi:MAG: glycosyltransferase family 4 protein [Bacteroidales bacterium]|jgi:glycosyltransferase involved in cell wall biosynthesis